MQFLSKELVTMDYRTSLQRDLAQAKVCRFLIAYVSGEGIKSVGRHLLARALADPRSYGMASMSCACKYEPLLKLQDELGDDVRLKYFMDPVVDEKGEPSDIALFHSKLVYLYLERTNKSIVYLGSHNWSRRALGIGAPRNAEASLRLEFDFEEEHLEGVGASIAAEVNQHLETAWQMRVCVPATRDNEPKFEQWVDKACRSAPSVPMEQNIIVLAVRDGRGPADWSTLHNSSIYLQILDEADGLLILEKSNNKLLLMVWESEEDLIAARQPVLLEGRISNFNAGPNSSVSGSNQSTSPISGFRAVVLDKTELAGRQERRFERRLPVKLWSGREVGVYDFELPAPSDDCASYDRGIDPNYRYLLEVEAVVMPTDRSPDDSSELAWSPESFTVAESRRSTNVEASPGYFVEPEVEQEMLECLREVLLVETDKAKVLPFSQADNAKLGKRVSNHPLHETFLGNQLNDASIRDEYYRESRKGSLLAELNTAEDVDRSKPLKRLQRVYTAPVKDLLEEWRERAADLRRQEHPRNPRDE